MTLSTVPKRSKAIVVRKADQSGPYKFDTVLEDRDVPPLKDGQVLIKIEAAGFNHREVGYFRSFARLLLTCLGLDPERSVPRDNYWECLRRRRSGCVGCTM